MKKVKIVLVVLLGLVLCSAAVPKKADYKKKAETFLSGIIRGQIDESYDELISNTLLESKPQQVKLAKGQTSAVINIYGKLLDYEFIKQQKYGDSIVRIVYVLKSEQAPFTWEFYFYKAVSDWKLIQFNFNDKFDLLADK